MIDGEILDLPPGCSGAGRPTRVGELQPLLAASPADHGRDPPRPRRPTGCRPTTTTARRDDRSVVGRRWRLLRRRWRGSGGPTVIALDVRLLPRCGSGSTGCDLGGRGRLTVVGEALLAALPTAKRRRIELHPAGIVESTSTQAWASLLLIM